MPRLSNLDKAHVIGQVEVGVLQNQVAALFEVSPGSISKLKFCEAGTPRIPVTRRLSSRDLQARFAGRYGIQISDQTFRNRLNTADLPAHKATRKPAMTALHC